MNQREKNCTSSIKIIVKTEVIVKVRKVDDFSNKYQNQ